MNPNINIEEFLPRLGGQEPEDGKARYHNQDVEKILEAWINERYSPELMIYQEELVSNLIEMLEAQVENVSSLREANLGDQVSVILYEQEMERIKYVLQSYLRTRLAKIQNYTTFFLQSEVYRPRMSNAEIRFAESFEALVKSSFSKSFLDQVPAYTQGPEETSDAQTVRKPNLERAVICRVKEEIGEVYVSESESVMMKSGNIYILRYDTVRSILEKGMVELI